MIFAFYSSILEIITQFAIINSIKRGSKNEKEKLMFKYCHSWYCPKKLVWKAHAGRFSPLFSLLLRKCLWGLKRSLVCFLLDIIYTFKKKKKKWAKSLNENSSQHFHTMVRKTNHLEMLSWEIPLPKMQGSSSGGGQQCFQGVITVTDGPVELHPRF